jgi:uncharacterized repeat protein (TIGR01451 family)
VAGGKIYALGGSPDCCGNSQTQVVEVYDPAGNSWTTAAPMPVAQQVSAAAGFGGRVLVFGGFIPGSGVQPSTLEYDPEADSWVVRANMLTARDQAPAAATDAGVHVLGGSTDCHCQSRGENEFYQPIVPIIDQGSESDVRVTKSNGVEELVDGDTVSYLIKVKNLGPDPVEGVLVSDTFSKILGDPAWTCAAVGGARCTPSGSGDILDRVDLPVGAEVIYTATAIVAAGLGTAGSPFSPLPDPVLPRKLSNTATATLPDGAVDPDPSNNTSTDKDFVVPARPPEVELAITQRTESGLAVFSAGDTVVFLIEITNFGSADTFGAIVTDRLPPAFDAAAATWTCTASGDADCSDGTGDIFDRTDIPAGDSLSYRLIVPLHPTFLGPVSNLVSVASLNPAAGRADSSISLTVFPEQKAGLQATKTVAGHFWVGGTVTYQVTLLNPGPGDQPDIQGLDEFVDELPAGLTFLDARATAGELKVDENTVRWNGSIPALTPVTIDMVARVEIGLLALRAPGERHAPEIVCNQGFLIDGVLTDEPFEPGTEDPTCFEARGEAPAIPTLSNPMQALFVLLLLILGWLVLRQRIGSVLV